MARDGHIILVGMPGSGKTTAARGLGRALGRPVADLDEALAAQAQVTVADLLRRESEEAFRQREAAALDRILEGPPAVVATGGGTASFHQGMDKLLRAGTVVWLDVSVAALAERVLKDAADRPLLGDSRTDVERNLRTLAQARISTYARAHTRVDASGAPSQVVERIAAAVQSPWILEVGAAAGNRVTVHPGEPAGAADAIAALCQGAQVALVIDRAVSAWAAPLEAQLQARGLPTHAITVGGGERVKTPRVLGQLWTEFARLGLGRRDVVVAIGGGATTDLAGLAAATWQRGVRWIALPTTLLAMADASVGGKTAIDLPAGKNLVGAFHPAELVWCGLRALDTLPVRHHRGGLAEIAKIFLAFDADAWTLMMRDGKALRGRDPTATLRHLRAAIAWKAKVVAADPREMGGRDDPLARAKLNLGHTFGHAVEAARQFGLPHGEAVGLGLCAEAAWAQRHAGLAADDCTQVVSGLRELGLNTAWQPYATADTLQRSRADKKLRGGQLRLPVLVRVGNATLADVDRDVWQAQLTQAAASSAPGRM
ncbi:MAG: bifunctional shikimate kinase/3-dehydroquinate synthase [Deltaproteobacteria bacterium]|nr:bifunctional shikimate kinase/3-dehydroquinate synthase [Deltaproteobacteria bacterium]